MQKKVMTKKRSSDFGQEKCTPQRKSCYAYVQRSLQIQLPHCGVGAKPGQQTVSGAFWAENYYSRDDMHIYMHCYPYWPFGAVTYRCIVRRKCMAL